MDEFELAGFDGETCEQLRKISADSGVDPSALICIARQYQTDAPNLGEYARLGIAWDVFKRSVWSEFEQSKIGKFIIWIADKLGALIERFKV